MIFPPNFPVLRVTLGFACLLCLGGCAFPHAQSSDERDAIETCREDVNRSYNAQHRDYLSQRGEPDTPFSGATPPPLPSDGLSDRYAYEDDVSTCLKRSAAVPVQGGEDGGGAGQGRATQAGAR